MGILTLLDDAFGLCVAIVHGSLNWRSMGYGMMIDKTTEWQNLDCVTPQRDVSDGLFVCGSTRDGGLRSGEMTQLITMQGQIHITKVYKRTN
jgi:hypothetical protein